MTSFVTIRDKDKIEDNKNFLYRISSADNRWCLRSLINTSRIKLVDISILVLFTNEIFSEGFLTVTLAQLLVGNGWDLVTDINSRLKIIWS